MSLKEMTEADFFARVLPDRDRGAGRTTEQIKNAPQGAYFVSLHGDYSRLLARELGRADLKHISVGRFLDPGWSSGRAGSHVVIDHAVNLTTRIDYAIEYAEARRLKVTR